MKQQANRPKETVRMMCAQARRSPMYLVILDDYNSYYWSGHRDRMSFADWQAAAAFLARYHSLAEAAEAAADWREVDRINWADNSVTVTERDRRGNTRTRMTAAPSGDRCF